MRILNVAYPFAPVGHDAVGGAEQVLTQIAEALTHSNHDSFVLACSGSKLNASLFELPHVAGMIDAATRREMHVLVKRCIEEVIVRQSVELIHFHGVDFLEYLPTTVVPLLATLHLPLSWYPEHVFTSPVVLQCVSASQRRTTPRNLPPHIDNGVPIERLRADLPRQDFALCLGRICPEKGYHHALAAARSAGVDFVLAGEVFPYASHIEYFETQLAPHLNEHIRYVGPADFALKRDLLNSARCLLIPSTVPETSSLIAMEAMACGTPVIAFPNGALPELIEHKTTGFLVQNESEMAESIHLSSTIDPAVCQEVARRRFDVRQMTNRYLETYRSLIDDARLQSAEGAQEVRHAA